LLEWVGLFYVSQEKDLIGISSYIELAFAAILLLLGARKKNRLCVSASIVAFAFALATLAWVHGRSGTYWLAVLYGAASISQIYAAYRTWSRWPKIPDDATTKRE
jgi:hypothetical protein